MIQWALLTTYIRLCVWMPRVHKNPDEVTQIYNLRTPMVKVGESIESQESVSLSYTAVKKKRACLKLGGRLGHSRLSLDLHMCIM